jgi:hypothetical protein
MPINKDEWNSGRTADTSEARVENFLKANKGQAFTPSEIAASVFGLRQINSIGEFISNFGSLYLANDALKTLLKDGRIQAREIRRQFGSETYYSV